MGLVWRGRLRSDEGMHAWYAWLWVGWAVGLVHTLWCASWSGGWKGLQRVGQGPAYTAV